MKRLLIIGFVILLGVLIHAMVAGRRAGRNPWGSATLEWATTSPPPLANFHEDPPVTDPYDYSNLVYDQKTENWEPRRA